jgi:methylated-DNA-protein-cysteine methyltransferase-like protein
MKMSDFTVKVISLVKQIPRGKVATYGQIARLAGKPHGARGVGWILHSCTETHGLPWQRVLNSQGKISFPVRSKLCGEQRRRLKAEGVCFLTSASIDLEKYQWKKKPRAPRASRGAPKMFQD